MKKFTNSILVHCLTGFFVLTGMAAHAWNLTDLANGTNYISSPGGYTNNVYFSAYQITNDTGITCTNIWVKMGAFTNGSGAPNIGLGGKSPSKKSLGYSAPNTATPFYFCMSATNGGTSATNAISLYNGDPDAGGILLTNILFTKNYVILVTRSANGSSAGTNYLSTASPTLGSFLTITSTYTIGNASSKSGLYASYPAVSNSWDATTFSLVANSFWVDTNYYPNAMVGNVSYSKAATLTNIATFQVINTKASTTAISGGGFVNTGNGAVPNYILPGTAGVLAPIPAVTNSLLLTNWASVTAAYTNTTVYFTNKFSNTGPLDASVGELVCTLPRGFVYAGSPTFAGVVIDNPSTNAPAATNYVLTFSQGYTVPANSSAVLVFAAVPTNALDVAGGVTNRAVLTTYSAYGLIGTNQIDLTYDTTDNATPTNNVRVLLPPAAANDAFTAYEDTTLTVAAPGVLANDNEPNGFTMTVLSCTQPAHGSVTVNADGSFAYLGATNYNGSDSFTYTLTNGNARAAAATVNLTVTAVNDPPSFTKGADQSGLANAGAQTVTGWATAISAGPADESAQTLTFHVSNNNSSLFSVPPAVAANGALTYTPAGNAAGSATVTLYLTDNGGTANGGRDTSATNTFLIMVNKATPAFSGLNASQSSIYGATGITLSGKVSAAGSVTLYPASGEAVSVTINGNTQTTTVNDATGDFSFSYNPATIPYSATPYTITYAYAGNTFLNSTNATSTTLTVNKAVLGITANSTNRAYGAANPAFTYTASGFVNGETTGVLGGSPGLTTTATTNSPVSTCTITAAAGSLSAANYSFSFTNGTLTVNAAALGITASNQSKTYGATLTFGAGQTAFASSGLQNGETIGSVTITASGGTAANAAAGTYSLTPSAAAGGTFTAGNYSIAYTNGTLTVNKAAPALTVATSGSPMGYKSSVNFTATLPADATGFVLFLTNNAASSSNNLSAGSAASAATILLPRGTNTITAQYFGDGNYLGATNALAGGQVITNHPPVAGSAYGYTNSVISFRLPLANLTANFSDADADTLTVTSCSTSTNGVTPAITGGLFYYYNTNRVNDQFGFVVTDGYGGSATGSVKIVFFPFLVGQNGTFAVAGGKVNLQFYGISGYPYAIERSTNLTTWTVILTTNAPASNVFKYQDTFSDLGTPPVSAYYRLKYNP